MPTATKPAGNEAEKPKEPAVKFYRSRLDGLKVLVGDNNAEGYNDPDLLEYVRFDRYTEKFQGDDLRVGYLATDNTKVHKLLANDANVTELTEAEFTAATEAAKRVI